jgi:DNA repair exonuclease SbcCD ATPase subunit
MILQSLKIENFRSYEQATIEFSEGQNYFFGRNWQGKSSIMDAIGFAFFGRNIFPQKIAGSPVKVDHLVREGATQGSVELTFEHSQEIYRLYRECPSNTVEFWRGDKLIGEGINPVKERLANDFGLDSKLFASVFYSEQDDLRRIVESNPEERKVFVEMLLGFDYLKDIKMSAKHAADELSGYIEEITSGNIKTIIDMIADAKRQVGDKEKVVKGLEDDIEQETKPGAKSSDISRRLVEGEKQTKQLLQKKSQVETERDTDSGFISSIKTGKCPTCKQAIPKDLQLKLIHELNEKIEELETRLGVLGKDYSKANLDWGRASTEHDEDLERIERLSNFKLSKRQNELELGTLKTSLAKYEKQYKAYSDKNKAIELVSKERSFLEDFQLAIDGFRESLRKSMTVDLENGVNYFMSQFNDYDFDARLKITDDFGFEVNLHNRPSPIFNLSGAARDILALALRYGLYRVAARDVNFILFDEPTRHMDATNTLKLKQAFNAMKNQQVIVITVHDEFFDAEGRKFMIEKNPDLLSIIRRMN